LAPGAPVGQLKTSSGSGATTGNVWTALLRFFGAKKHMEVGPRLAGLLFSTTGARGKEKKERRGRHNTAGEGLRIRWGMECQQETKRKMAENFTDRKRSKVKTGTKEANIAGSEEENVAGWGENQNSFPSMCVEELHNRNQKKGAPDPTKNPAGMCFNTPTWK